MRIASSDLATTVRGDSKKRPRNDGEGEQNKKEIKYEKNINIFLVNNELFLIESEFINIRNPEICGRRVIHCHILRNLSNSAVCVKNLSG
ncbi:MAG: hypothetical protein FWG98_10185 [Candidatus Cloacimonetes bacterium]|nr:hypothetical protein [Candidatus Cloacimonadota bacterium]